MSEKPVRAVKLNVINEPKAPTLEENHLYVQVVDTTKSPALLLTLHGRTESSHIALQR